MKTRVFLTIALLCAVFFTVADAGLITQSGARFFVEEGGGGDPESDFASRCAAAGVVYCNGFDDAGDLAEGTVGLNCSSANKSSLDASQKTSGDSALRFEFTSGVNCPNVGGNWQYTHSPAFGSGDDIYIQYRVRGTAAYYTIDQSSTLKQLNMHGTGSSCQSTELTTILYQQRIEAYHTCAGISLITDPGTGAYIASCNGTGGSCLLNQASQLSPAANIGYNCNYQDQESGDGNGPGCFWPVGDKWYTIYLHYSLGTPGSSNSGYYGWEAHDGGPFLQFMNIDGDAPWSSDGSDTYSEFWLETYMTELDGAVPATAYVWYDELIISTQPIALPTSFAEPPLVNVLEIMGLESRERAA